MDTTTFSKGVNRLKAIVQESVKAKERILGSESLLTTIYKVSEEFVRTFNNGNKILFCGNGGSAADCQHLAAELSGKYYLDRNPLPAEALHVNTSYLTAVANDYSFAEVFSRQIKAVGKTGDILVGISTSGNSANVIGALEAAKGKEMLTIGLTGESGGLMKDHCTYLIRVPSHDTPRIQECHIMIGHAVCELVEAELFGKK